MPSWNEIRSPKEDWLNSKMFALFLFSLLSVSSYGKDQRALLEANIVQELSAYNISSGEYTITRVTSDHLVASPTGNLPDAFAEEIRREPTDWEKDPKIVVFFYHHHVTQVNSWRTRTSPSLHVTKIADRKYSVDIDFHAPSFRHPIESAKHFREIVWHFVSRTKTNQKRVAVLLARKLR
jgi:hypothetical protein